MAMRIFFNDQTQVGTNGALVAEYLNFLPVVAQLSVECSILHYCFDRTSQVVAFRDYLFRNGDVISSRIGVQKYARLKDLFLRFLHPSDCPDRGIVQTGLNTGREWCALVHLAAGGEWLCVTMLQHVDEQVFLRWAFANGLVPFAKIKHKMLPHDYKHYRLQAESPCVSRVSRHMSWVRSTGHGGTAQFRPGLTFAGSKTEEIVRRLLEAAFEERRLSHNRLRGFVGHFDEIIGASCGMPVNGVQIDINPQDEYHLIPML